MVAMIPVLTSVLLLQSAMQALPTQASDDVPRWLTRPSAAEVERAARKAAVDGGGEAVMRCIVTAQGTMRDCVLVSERPAKRNLGKALLMLAPEFTMTPTTRTGRSVEGQSVTIPVRLNVSD